MIRIMLSDDRNEVDMDRLAEAFAISRNELEDNMRVGGITSWFELGGSDYDKPRIIFRLADTGVRVTLDHVGSVILRTDEEAGNLRSHPSRTGSRASVTEDASVISATESARRAHLETLLDAALEGTFPASDPIAVSFEPSYPTPRNSGGPS